MHPEHVIPGGVDRASPTGVAILTGPHHLISYASPELARWWPGRRLVGRTAGHALTDVIDLPDLLDLLDTVRATGVVYQTSHDLRASFHRDTDTDTDGPARVAYVSLTLSPLSPTSPGEATEQILLVAIDTTEQIRARRAQDLRGAREQMLLRLVSASTQFLSTESKLAAVAAASVPAVADVCAVYLLDTPVAAGRRPDAPISTWRITAPTSAGVLGPVPQRPALWTGGDPATAAVTTAAVAVVHYTPDAPPDWAAAAGVDLAIRDGRVHCTAMVPVIVDGDVHAVIAFGAGPDRAPYDDHHRELFALIGAQTAVAMRQGGRYDHVRNTALTLQRAMLTTPPAVPGLDICVRYRPAGLGVEVGGDWHDVFPLIDHRPDRPSVAVVVGDVAGHDVDAATVMGQLRSMLRGIALHGADSPDRTLTALDGAMRHLRLVTLATGIVMHVQPSAGPDDPTGLALTWSNAGHPSPVLLAPDGTTTALDAPRDPALGVTGRTRRVSATHRLPPGAVLLLFSDGLFERRTVDYDTAFERLLATIGTTAGLTLDKLCDELLDAAPHDDDVVLVALRQLPTAPASGD